MLCLMHRKDGAEMTVGEILNEAKRKKGVSIPQICEATNISERSWSAYISGERSLNEDTAKLLCDFLDIPYFRILEAKGMAPLRVSDSDELFEYTLYTKNVPFKYIDANGNDIRPVDENDLKAKYARMGELIAYEKGKTCFTSRYMITKEEYDLSLILRKYLDLAEDEDDEVLYDIMAKLHFHKWQLSRKGGVAV